MKRFIILSLFFGIMPSLSMFAQDDDLYFVPRNTSKATRKNVSRQGDNAPAYYSGSNRDIDEYNRHGKYWSHYQVLGSDSLGNDIIQFRKGVGVYPDSTYIDTTFVGKYYDRVYNVDDDYTYTRRMSRWDNFYDPWFYSYRWGYDPYWDIRCGWYDPWYTSYYGWYDPWYYGYRGWYGSWYSPWYGGYYGWRYPYDYYWGWSGYPGYVWGGVHRVYSGHTGTLGYYDRSNYIYNRSSYGNGINRDSYSRNSYGHGKNSNRDTYTRGNVTFGPRRSRNIGNNTPTYNNNSSFGTSRSNNSSSFGSSSFGGSRGGSFSGGGEGGSFSGGSTSGGGIRPVGGGHNGGGRR